MWILYTKCGSYINDIDYLYAINKSFNEKDFIVEELMVLTFYFVQVLKKLSNY